MSLAPAAWTTNYQSVVEGDAYICSDRLIDHPMITITIVHLSLISSTNLSADVLLYGVVLVITEPNPLVLIRNGAFKRTVSLRYMMYEPSTSSICCTCNYIPTSFDL